MLQNTEYNNYNAPPLLSSQRQFLVARSTDSSTSSSPSSTASSSSTSITSIAIPVAVGGPAVLVAIFLGYFLIRNYKMNKKEEKEFLEDPNFAPDEQGLPDYPIPKNLQRQNTKIKTANSGNTFSNKFKRPNKGSANDAVSLPFEGEFSNDHSLHEYVKTFGHDFSPYSAFKHPSATPPSNLSNTTQDILSYNKVKFNIESSDSNLDGSTLKSSSDNGSPYYKPTSDKNNNSSPLKNETYRNNSTHSMVGETNPYSAYQQASDPNDNHNHIIQAPPPVAKSPTKNNEYMNVYLENPYAPETSGSESNPYLTNNYIDSTGLNYDYVEPIKDDSFAATVDQEEEETSDRLKSVYNMYFDRMSRTNTLRIPNTSNDNKPPPIPPAPPKSLHLQNLQSSTTPPPYPKLTHNTTQEPSLPPNTSFHLDKPLSYNAGDRDSNISSNSILEDMATSDVQSRLYSSTYLGTGNSASGSPAINSNSYYSEPSNVATSKAIQAYPDKDQPITSKDTYTTNYQSKQNGGNSTVGYTNNNNHYNSYEHNYDYDNNTYQNNDGYSHSNYSSSYQNSSNYQNNYADGSYQETNYNNNYSSGYNNSVNNNNYVDSSYAVNSNNFISSQNNAAPQKQLAPPAPIYNINSGLVNGPNKVPTAADVARQSISMLNTVDLKSTKKYKPAASASARMMTPQYGMPVQQQMPGYHQPKYLVSNAKRRNPNDLRKKLNVDPMFL